MESNGYAPSCCFLKIKQTEHIYDNRYNQIRLKVAPVEVNLLKHQYDKSG